MKNIKIQCVCELYFNYKKLMKKKEKEIVWVCVLCFIYLIFMLFCYKKNIKLKNMCFLCKWPNKRFSKIYRRFNNKFIKS